jgi:hypothetical protein
MWLPVNTSVIGESIDNFVVTSVLSGTPLLWCDSGSDSVPETEGLPFILVLENRSDNL